MPKHKLTKKNRIKGIKAALRSKKTPIHLKAGLQRHLDSLLAPRHALSVDAQIKGIRAALVSEKTPIRLKTGLQTRLDFLLAQQPVTVVQPDPVLQPVIEAPLSKTKNFLRRFGF